MTSPYTTPPTPQPARPAPKWARKRYVLPAIGLAFVLGGIGAGADDSSTDAKTTAAKPGPTTTVTATATATETAKAEAESAPTVTATETVKVKVTKTVTARPAAADDNSSDSGGGNDVYYANCSEARAAGAAPIHRGEPGYGSHLDRDGDGVGCDS
ncbi:excalibur calcium-binding domain-containing protein [Streptomyces phaeochromogenes]|uniref:Excalibur calcium-binding domain-containing protein n=1 Tax=Streptomyces phaeochromogenes TaxID=1923 RepID=A0ABZ1HQG5_STRPH|nr:excalibur calcium-binding domain-containing protein [Streptomyces phaeochromogenes]WRZ35623.1 excalibur calcium-binding domain-containing protein [Streptomyces phaeochromogenes]WSD20847.1 excalibur calcium-binding domain-containing protein [Streptomyces phaeochromogenes]